MAAPVSGEYVSMCLLTVRCKNCRCFIHLRCSYQPEQMLVRLIKTLKSLFSSKCVRTMEMSEEKYGVHFEKAQALMVNIRRSL